ncbi:carotenoid biosynthesis protein [Thermococcus sp. 18S1]|uniref:carotenoid biosynthesis protein n=1 Tax=Thermococcus sp. 18S1 TaxID=1638210 RepID=UPI00143AEA0C|nr:carotenoid biosynthesis protein [Thermococcus sp. 18S1]NJE29628.1 carotenoid biosynthesis protein [Thermococcus sp. 18S1]
MGRDLRIVLALILLANLLKRSPIYNIIYLLAMIVVSRRLWRDFPKFFLISVIVGFLAEIVGTNLCTPFGCYHYENLQPQVFGVAVFVPFAWAVFGLVSYLTARYFLEDNRFRLVFASLLMVVLDLSIDPIMTWWDAWVWDTTTAINWFGIPWTNYLGWFVVSLTFFCLYERFSKVRIEKELLQSGPAIYLLEMITFALYAPEGVRTPTFLALLIAVVLIVPTYIWRCLNEGCFNPDEG